MSFEEEVFVTSRSRTPSLIDVTSQNESVFAQLPDLIQEAIVSTEFSSQKLRINRVYNAAIDIQLASTGLTKPMFYVRSRTDSGVDLPDLDVKDEKFLGKYGSDLTANFADIRAYGPKAFFRKQNMSDSSTYSVCACATGYIWVSTTIIHLAEHASNYSDVEVQIGTYALKARAITTTEIPCKYKFFTTNSTHTGEISFICSTVLAKYLRLRMIGKQCEEAEETAISQTKTEFSPHRIDSRGRFQDYEDVLRRICENAPLPPTSDVSLISRSMITKRWQYWRESSVLRKRYSIPGRVLRCFKPTQHDSIDLLSGCFKVLVAEKPLKKKARGDTI